MALLRELGTKYPCSTQGLLIDLEDETIQMNPGDIVEAWYEADRDISYLNIAPAVEELLKMKEQYPDFVLHYIRFETRKVIVQFSAAPRSPISGSPQRISASIQALTWAIVLMILAIAAIITVFIAVNLKAFRGYWLTPPKPTGDALAVAKDRVTGLLLAGVKISTDGRQGTTGPNGEGVLFDDLLVGDHTFVGATVTGYDPPSPVTAAVQEDKVVNVIIAYNPEGTPPPTHGWLIVDTDPLKGKVFIDGQDKGEAPVSVYLTIGDHTISFGTIEGWITPEQQTITIHGDPIQDSTIGYYTRPGEWWEKYVKYALIGTAAIAGAAIAVPKIIKAMKEKA